MQSQEPYAHNRLVRMVQASGDVGEDILDVINKGVHPTPRKALIHSTKAGHATLAK